MQPATENKPWILPEELFDRALEASYNRSYNYIEQANANPSLNFYDGPDLCPGHDRPKPMENGWAADENGRWFGPDEYFITNWQCLVGGPVTPSPHPPLPQELFSLDESVILARALKAGYVPDDVAGCKQVSFVPPAPPISAWKRAIN